MVKVCYIPVVGVLVVKVCYIPVVGVLVVKVCYIPVVGVLVVKVCYIPVVGVLVVKVCYIPVVGVLVVKVCYIPVVGVLVVKVCYIPVVGVLVVKVCYIPMVPCTCRNCDVMYTCRKCDVTDILPFAGNRPSAADVSKDAEEEGWSLLGGVAGMPCKAVYVVLLLATFACTALSHCLPVVVCCMGVWVALFLQN